MGEDAVVAPVAAMVAGDAAAEQLGISVEAAGDGCARARMVVRPDMVNGHAMAHGGVIFTLADTAFACACNSYGDLTVASAAEITFLAPATVGDDLEAEARVRTVFGRHGIYDVTVRRGQRVIAEFRGHSTQPARPT